MNKPKFEIGQDVLFERYVTGEGGGSQYLVGLAQVAGVRRRYQQHEYWLPQCIWIASIWKDICDDHILQVSVGQEHVRAAITYAGGIEWMSEDRCCAARDTERVVQIHIDRIALCERDIADTHRQIATLILGKLTAGKEGGGR